MPAYAIQKESIPHFLLKVLLYWNSSRNAGKTGFKLQDTYPDLQNKLSAPAWAHKRRAPTLVVGVITNEFHKVLVYSCVQVAYAWKWEENAAHEQGDTSWIWGNNYSMNQMRSRGSTGLPEHQNRLKTGPYPYTWHGGPPNCNTLI